MSLRFRPSSILPLVALVALGVLPMVAAAQSAAGSLTVSLPQDVTAKAGAEFTLPLKVSEGKNIGAFALSIIYDPAKVDYVKTTGSAETTGFKFVDGKIDADGGMKELILGGTSSTKIAASGPLVLANLTFTAKSTASGAITFQLKNPTDDIASATLESGKVTIGSGIAAPSTPQTAVSTPPATTAPATMTPTAVPTAEPTSVPTAEPTTVPTAEPTTVPTDTTGTGPASEVSAPDVLDQTGPAEVAGLLALSMGFALLLQGKRRSQAQR